MSKLFFASLILILSLSFAAASNGRVAYILEDNTFGSAKHEVLYSILGDYNLQYDIFRDSQVPSADLSEYSIIIVADNINNEQFVPYEETNTIFFDTDSAVEVWPIQSNRVGTTQSRDIRSTNNIHPLFDGVLINVNNDIEVYDTFIQPITLRYLLSPLPPEVTRIATTGSTSQSTLAYSTSEFNGEPVKNLFYGASDFNKWTSESEEIFSNSIEWFLEDIDMDGDDFVFSEDCNDNDPSIYPDADEVPYDGIDQNCDGVDLLDVDEDGFCEEGFQITSTLLQCSAESGLFGTDCDDTDIETNTLSSFPEFNCINDAPVINSISHEDSYIEGDTILIEIDASDYENDQLQITSDNANFVVDENLLVWETSYDDAGEYEIIITLSDAEFSTSETIFLEVLDSNRAPIFVGNDEIIEIDEDSSITVELNTLFEDPDGTDLQYAFDQIDIYGDVLVDLTESELEIISLNDFFESAGFITLEITDGEDTIYKEFEILVNPINDAPEQIEVIEDIELDEDTSFENALDLNDYFVDVDSELDFSVSGNTHLEVTLTNGEVSIVPEQDFSGSETLVFTASDGEFSLDSNPFQILVIDVGEPPIFSALNCEILIEEDSTHTCVLEATDFEDNDLVFEVIYSENMDCEISGSNLTYTPFADYTGNASCEIIVSDNDGYDSALLEISVSPINDAPILFQQIPSVELSEDEDFLDYMNLNDYFLDVDSDLEFSISGNSMIEVSIDESGSMSFILPPEYFGSETLVFTASDGEFAVNSTVEVVVSEVGDAPVFNELNCEINLLEDQEYFCDLSATDIENDDIVFFVSDENNMDCEISGSTLTYTSSKDYFGNNAFCELEARDNDGSDFALLDVSVENVNDAPIIKKTTPSNPQVRVLENTDKSFSIESLDTDSETEITWYLNGVENLSVSDDMSDFTIKKGKGVYLLEAIISDSEFSTSHLWSVVFGPSTDFTCSELGGFVCEESSSCSSSLLNVKDTNSCCKTSCAPSFRKADACEVLGQDIVVNIRNPRESSLLKVGDDVKVEVDITNNMDEDEDFDVEFHLFDLDDESSEESVDNEISIDEGRKGVLRLDLPIPSDIDLSHKYAIFVKVDGEQCNQDYVPVEIDRPEKKLSITKFEMLDRVVCGEGVQGKINVENVGEEDLTGVKLSLSNSALGLSVTDTFDIEEADADENKFVKDLVFIVPSEIEPGTYDAKLDITYEGRRETLTKKIEVSCKPQQLESELDFNSNAEELEESFFLEEDEKLTLNNIKGVKSLSIFSKQPNFLIIAEILLIDFMLLAMIGILHAAEVKRRIRKSSEK